MCALDRTKVVLRHLPPTIFQSNLIEHINSRFSGRYHWLAFRPGKPGLKHLLHSRAYIDFNRAEDVIEFAEFFNGHVFVNEKGVQFKAIVEYAPSQCVPKHWPKKDGREGTVLKDPEYMEFLEFLAKPVENLPSAEIQLERKEAERAGAPKDIPIVTPLMEYVRQKRVAKFGVRKFVEWEGIKKSRWIFIQDSCLKFLKKRLRKEDFYHHGVLQESARAALNLSGTILGYYPVKVLPSKTAIAPVNPTLLRYVVRDSSKGVGDKDKPSYLLVPKHDDQQLADKSATLDTDIPERINGGPGSTGSVKKKILLLNRKEKETSNVTGGSLLQQNASISSQKSHSSAPYGHDQLRETNARTVRSVLLNKCTYTSQLSTGSQSETRIQASNQVRDKRPPRPPSLQSFQKETNGVPEDKVVNSYFHAFRTEKQERRTKNKDKPDRVIWTPLRRSEGSHASDDSLSSSASRTSQVLDSAEFYALPGADVDVKNEMLVTSDGNYKHIGTGRTSHYSVENGSSPNGRRRGSAYNVKDADVSSVVGGKLFKRGVFTGHGSHESKYESKSPVLAHSFAVCVCNDVVDYHIDAYIGWWLEIYILLHRICPA
ncbi:hypothetical protein OROGR_004242 [Orobanche gracilis]